jgi:hypothetical protein
VAEQDTATTAPGDGTQRRGRWARLWTRLWAWRRWAIWIICVLLLAVAIRAEAPLVAKAIRSFGHLRWGAVAGAIALETALMVAFGLMERRILILAGPELPVGWPLYWHLRREEGPAGAETRAGTATAAAQAAGPDDGSRPPDPKSAQRDIADDAREGAPAALGGQHVGVASLGRCASAGRPAACGPARGDSGSPGCS